MTPRTIAADWLDGCRHLLDFDDIPAYRRLSWWRRRCVDGRVALDTVAAPGFPRAAFWVAVATCVAHVVTWRFDLVAAPRDLLRAAPILLSIPWLVTVRRRRIRALLRFREAPHRQGVDDV